MKAIKQMLPSILMILLGVAIGVLLIIDAEKLTEFVFTLFGAALLLMTLIMLIRFFAARKTGEDTPAMLFMVAVSLIAGLILVLGSGMIVQAGSTLCAIFYGAVMLINGSLKIGQYISLRKQHAVVSPLLVISGILSIVMGVVTLVFCSEALKIVGRIIGISMIVSAVLDLFSTIFGYRKTRTIILYETTGDDSDYDLE